MTDSQIVQILHDEFRKDPRFNRNQIAIKYNFNYQRLIKLACAEGLNKPLYRVNENFFEQISTENQAYWLGFLYADGCLTRNNGINLLLSSVDRDHLLQYKNTLQAENPIEDRVDGGKGNSKIRITSAKLFHDLKSLGCEPQKTFTLKFPNVSQVPRHLTRHFIRGYFDGDGSVWESKTHHGKYKQLQCSITSTTQMIDEITKVLYDNGLTNIEISNHPTSEGISILKIRRNNDVIKFYNYLYNGSSVFLPRKKQKFLNFKLTDIIPQVQIIRDVIARNFMSVQFSSLDIKNKTTFSLNTIQKILLSLNNSGFIIRVGNKKRLFFYVINKKST